MDGTDQIVVIALGNRFRGDDGVGPAIADRLSARPAACRIVAGVEDSLAIINAWTDADIALIVDAAASGAAPGTVHRFDCDANPLPRELGRCSSHGLGLAEAIALAKALGRAPGRLVLYAVEAKTFAAGAALSAEVSAAADRVAEDITAEIASLMTGAEDRAHA